MCDGTQEERARSFTTLVSAFRADPVERWLYPSDDAFDEHFPAFVEAFGGGAFAHDTAWQVDDFAGVRVAVLGDHLAPGFFETDEGAANAAAFEDESLYFVHGVSFARSASFTCCGFALPLEAFIT